MFTLKKFFKVTAKNLVLGMKTYGREFLYSALKSCFEFLATYTHIHTHRHSKHLIHKTYD